MIAHPVAVAVDSVVTVTRDGDDVTVVVQFRPFGEQLPRRLGSARSVTATRDDAKRTKLPIRSVRIERDKLHVTVAAGDAQRFTLRFAAMAHGSDSVAVSLLDDAAFDPKEETAADEPDATRTLVDYLSKDFRSFKRLMLDSIAHKAPGFVEQHEADAAIALIDVLAFAADNLSYYQDAVATEAYLETARRRVSVRRHARLLGYRLSEGCTPRVWLQVEPKVVFELTTGFKARTAVDQRVFQPLANVWLDPAIHGMSLSTDHGDELTLRKGATAATLVRDGSGRSPALARGTVLIFEEGDDPATAMPQQRKRQAVRLKADPIDSVHPSDAGRLKTRVTWWPEDALTFDLRARTAIVRGNIVPADYGETQDEITLAPGAFSEANATLRVPRTDLADVTFAVPYATDEPAKAFTELDPTAAVASRLTITATSFDEQLEWAPKHDLIAAERAERVFVVEVERSGAVLLRFGDGTNGERPDPSSRFTLSYRRGSGTDGHVGANTITEIAGVAPNVVSVTNPLPSAGGQPPEEIAQAKRWAPDQIRARRRCITADDYERVAQSVRGVTAYARRRWTGDRETVDVFVDAPGDLQRAIARVREVLASARMIGADVVVHAPRRIPVAVKLRIVCTPDAKLSEVERNVRARLQTALDKLHLTLGSTLFASWLIVAARDAAGVADVELQTFARWGGPDVRRDGFINVGPAELAVFVDESGTTTNGLPVIELTAQSS